MAYPLVRACQWLERRLRPPLRRFDVDPSAVQGFLTDGCERLPFGRMLLISTAGRRSLGECLRHFTPHSALAAPEVAFALALSRAGLERLGLPDATCHGFEPAFREGVTESARSARLGDVAGDAPSGWRWGGPGADHDDFMLLLHGATAEAVESARAEVEQKLARCDASCTFSLATAELPGRKEHFGFRGGIAQPHLHSDQALDRRLGAFKPGPRHNTIAPGEILLGYSNEFGDLPSSPRLPAALDPDGLLPQGAASGSNAPWRDLGANGSYLVVRQLEQDVQGFWRALDARSSDATERDRLAAKLVGRWRSGAPLVLSPERDRPELADVDDFDFEASDPRGARCPFGAHIRRANPRDWWLAGWAPFATRMSNQHRILRRSRPYGAPLAESMEPTEILGAADDHAERGLLFMAFNADIQRQFELIQEAWFNGPHFGRLRGEVDPLVGRSDLAGSFTVQGNPVAKRVHGLASSVRVRGSGYFFFPSIAAVRFLAQWALSQSVKGP
jgi:Dyp-type peroxidase family